VARESRPAAATLPSHRPKVRRPVRRLKCARCSIRPSLGHRRKSLADDRECHSDRTRVSEQLGPDDFQERIQLGGIYVLQREKDGLAYIGFSFGWWVDEEDGLGVVLHKDRCIDIADAAAEFEHRIFTARDVLRPSTSHRRWGRYLDAFPGVTKCGPDPTESLRIPTGVAARPSQRVAGAVLRGDSGFGQVPRLASTGVSRQNHLHEGGAVSIGSRRVATIVPFRPARASRAETAIGLGGACCRC